MLAVVKHGPEPGIVVEEVPEPEPRSDEVLIRVRAAGICGSDLHIWAGQRGYEWLRYPVIPGHEVAGQIIAAGSDVAGARIGERVVVNPYLPCGYCAACRRGCPQLCHGDGSAMENIPAQSLQIGFRRPGGFAELVTVPAAAALPLPSKLSFYAAAALEGFSVSVHALERSTVRPGDRVAVLGPGPIGLGLVLALSGMGLELLVLTGLSVDDVRLGRGSHLGATHTIKSDQLDLAGVVANLTGGSGLDVVFDTTGNPSAVEPAIRSLRRGGELILVGISDRTVQLELSRIVRAEIRLRGSYGITHRTLQRAIAMVDGGRVQVEQLVTDILPLSRAAEAFEVASGGSSSKVVLEP